MGVLGDMKNIRLSVDKNNIHIGGIQFFLSIFCDDCFYEENLVTVVLYT